ncbi:MAG: hypothetical protein PHC97_01195 [Patescibacteria group bacterium]|nr:hypothetical protein [Patescibacteria group bacterium]
MEEREEVISGLEELSELTLRKMGEKKLEARAVSEIRKLLENFCGQKMAEKSIHCILLQIAKEATDGKHETLLLTELHRQITECVEEAGKAKVIPLEKPCQRRKCRNCETCLNMGKGG